MAFLPILLTWNFFIQLLNYPQKTELDYFVGACYILLYLHQLFRLES